MFTLGFKKKAPKPTGYMTGTGGRRVAYTDYPQKKTAAFDHNNQGLEFKMSDMGSGNQGAGGMAPSGIPSYQPVDDSVKGPARKKAKARAAIQSMYKMSARLSDSGGSDIAPTTVSQLKWSAEPDLETEAANRKELKNKRSSYLKSRGKE